MLEYDFMRTAFAASGMAAVLAGTVGFFLVLRGQTFAGHALSHVGFTGATGAVLFGLSPLAGLVGFTFLSGIGMGLFGEKLAERDVAIGMMLSLALGLGLLFLHFYTAGGDAGGGAPVRQRARRRRSRAHDAGLAVDREPRRAGVRSPARSSSPRCKASSPRRAACRFASSRRRSWRSWRIAVAECAQIVGVLLVFTLMVGPAAAAQNLSRRLWRRRGAGGRSGARRGVGRADARLLHRLADQLLDHRPLRPRLSREPGRAVQGAVGRRGPSQAVGCEGQPARKRPSRPTAGDQAWLHPSLHGDEPRPRWSSGHFAIVSAAAPSRSLAVVAAICRLTIAIDEDGGRANSSEDHQEKPRQYERSPGRNSDADGPRPLRRK